MPHSTASVSSLDKCLAAASRVLRYGGQRRADGARRGNLVEVDNRDISINAVACLQEYADILDGGQSLEANTASNSKPDASSSPAACAPASSLVSAANGNA